MKRSLVLAMALLAFASLGACRGGTPVEYPLVRQYPGRLPAPPLPPAAVKPGASHKQLHFHVPTGWQDVTKMAGGPEGTIAIFNRDGDVPMMVAVHVSIVGDEPMEKSVVRIGGLVSGLSDMKDLHVDAERASFSWSSTKDWSSSVGHIVIVRLKDAPGATISFLGFCRAQDLDEVAKVVETMADSAEIH